MVKHSWISKILEKKYNSYLNSYIRLPGVLITCTTNLLNLYESYDTHTPKSLIVILSFLSMGNAIYFNYEACYNYGFRIYRAAVSESPTD